MDQQHFMGMYHSDINSYDRWLKLWRDWFNPVESVYYFLGWMCHEEKKKFYPVVWKQLVSVASQSHSIQTGGKEKGWNVDHCITWSLSDFSAIWSLEPAMRVPDSGAKLCWFWKKNLKWLKEEEFKDLKLYMWAYESPTGFWHSKLPRTAETVSLSRLFIFACKILMWNMK